MVIGGTSILGGRGHYLGTIAGAIILTVLTNVLTLLSTPEAGRSILYGLAILVALLVYGRQPEDVSRSFLSVLPAERIAHRRRASRQERVYRPGAEVRPGERRHGPRRRPR